MKTKNPIKILLRNQYLREGTPAQKNRVNLEWFRDEENLGDYLSTVVCGFMLDRKGLSFDRPVSHTKHLMAIGSLLGGRGDFDATVWGSGVMSFSDVCSLRRKKLFQKLDVRAVRGPITRDALLQCGIDCPPVYGDPAVLMPLFYRPKSLPRVENAVVLHFHADASERLTDVKYPEIKTNDYERFIDELCSAGKVISSSLHGIILAEAYGVPAVFLSQGRDREMMKYYDWYFSTGRRNVVMARTQREALQISPMPLPDLEEMTQALLDSFPYDLWES